MIHRRRFSYKKPSGVQWSAQWADLGWCWAGPAFITHAMSGLLTSSFFFILLPTHIAIVSSKPSHHSFLNQLTLVSNCLLNSWHSLGTLPKYQALGVWTQTFKLRDLPLSWLKVRRLRHGITVLFFKKKLGRSEIRHSHNPSQFDTSFSVHGINVTHAKYGWGLARRFKETLTNKTWTRILSGTVQQAVPPCLHGESGVTVCSPLWFPPDAVSGVAPHRRSHTPWSQKAPLGALT